MTFLVGENLFVNMPLHVTQVFALRLINRGALKKISVIPTFVEGS